MFCQLRKWLRAIWTKNQIINYPWNKFAFRLLHPTLFRVCGWLELCINFSLFIFFRIFILLSLVSLIQLLLRKGGIGEERRVINFSPIIDRRSWTIQTIGLCPIQCHFSFDSKWLNLIFKFSVSFCRSLTDNFNYKNIKQRVSWPTIDSKWPSLITQPENDF